MEQDKICLCKSKYFPHSLLFPKFDEISSYTCHFPGIGASARNPSGCCQSGLGHLCRSGFKSRECSPPRYSIRSPLLSKQGIIFLSLLPSGYERQMFHKGTIISLLELSLQPLSPPQTGMCLSSFWSVYSFFVAALEGRYLIPFCKHYLWTQNGRNMSLQIVCTTCPEPSYWHLLMSVPSAQISLSFCCKPDLPMQSCFHMSTTIVTDKLHLPSSVPVVCGSWLFLLRS